MLIKACVDFETEHFATVLLNLILFIKKYGWVNPSLWLLFPIFPWNDDFTCWSWIRADCPETSFSQYWSQPCSHFLLKCVKLTLRVESWRIKFTARQCIQYLRKKLRWKVRILRFTCLRLLSIFSARKKQFFERCKDLPQSQQMYT